MFKLWRQGVAIGLVAIGAFTHPQTTCGTTPTLIWPMPGPVNQGFSAGHPAIDIGAPIGTTVRASAPGTVVWAGWKTNGGGYVVDISHAGAVLTSYNHLNSVGVAVGQVVISGQRIAASGMTGMATGPHLHFGVQIAGLWVDPLPLLQGIRLASVPNTAMGCT